MDVCTADIIYCNLEGTEKVSIGSVSEMAWGWHLGKHVVLVMPEGNIHEHAFVKEFANIIFRTHEEAMAYLATLTKGI